MRKKIEELRNREEGFTLVELLAVIVILGIIVAIAIPAIGNVVSRAREDGEVAQIALIEDAARLYDIENPIPTEGVSVDDLEKSGYLEENGKTPRGTVKKVQSADADDDDNSFSYEFTPNGAAAGGGDGD